MTRPALARVLMLLVLSLAPPARADQPARTHAVTVEDYFTIAGLSDVAISPDGKLVAYASGAWRKETDDRKADLWVVPAEGKAEPRRLTTDQAGDHDPKWSPDGRTVYFLGSRQRGGAEGPPFDGKQQVWGVGVDGQGLTAVTRAAEGVQAYDLAPDGKSVVYVVHVPAAAESWRGLRDRFGDLTYGYGRRMVSQLWRAEVPGGRAERLFDGGRYVRELALAPDGRRAALITTPDETVVSFEGRSRVDLFDLTARLLTPLPDKAYRADAPSPWAWLETLAWAPDGSALAFVAVFDAYPAQVMVADLADDEPRLFRLPRPPGVSVRGYGTPLQWTGPKTLAFLGEEKARVRLYEVPTRPRAGEAVRVRTPGDVVVQGFSATPGGKRVALAMNGRDRLTELFLVDGESAPRPLTNLNPQVATWKLPQLSTVAWRSADGTEVEGVLELPPDWKPGQKVPLAVALHGGPTTAVYLHLDYDLYLDRLILPARGYAVLCPNYRGSTGYGDKFLTDLVSRENDRDVADVLAGVDELVARGVADPDRLAVLGWSNGGYLTNCVIAKTARFKAASSGAGIVDTVMEWGANDEPAYPTVFKTGFPWQRPEVYRRSSPTYELNRIRTPTLIHVGANDERCPPPQSRMLYRALREYVKVPTELLTYPGEPHGLQRYKHRQAKLEWDLAWFERYVKGE
jgi:dipeptidyl aminopeptidase/acylaminoacyl peptidase